MNENWEKHWKGLEKSFFGFFLKFFREKIIATSVAYYFEKYFTRQGLFVECGSGSSQTTIKVRKYNRRLIAVDISEKALEMTKEIKQIDERVLADIRKLPFADSSVDGIWNLGVMEHFTLVDIKRILKEFSRILKPGGYAILFWPSKKGWVHIGINTIESISKIFNINIDLFPDELNLLSKKLNMKGLIKESGFSDVHMEWNFRDLYIHRVIICHK